MKYFLRIDDNTQGPYDVDQIREMLGRGVVPLTVLASEEKGTGEWSPTYLPALIGPEKPPSPATGPYYIIEGSETRGPYTTGQLRGMWNTGSITGKTMHCPEGDSEWRPLSSILHQLEPPAAPPPVAAQHSVPFVTAPKSKGVYIKIGIVVVIATLGAYAVASLERQYALSEEEDLVTAIQNGMPSWGNRREAEQTERHRDALAAIERNYYAHFALIWLVTTGGLLALSGWMTKREG